MRSGRVMVALRLTCVGCVSAVLIGCQGVAGVPETPQVRVVHAAPGMATVDVYQGSGAVAYNLAFGNVTSYVGVAGGSNDFFVAASGRRDVLSSVRTTFAPYTSYTVLLGSAAAGPREIVLRDGATPVASGRSALRVVHEAVSAGPLDVYLVPAGSVTPTAGPVLGNHGVGSGPGYVSVAAGAYKVAIYPAGTAPVPGRVPAYVGSLVMYRSGSAHTLILLDGKNDGDASIQAIELGDGDSVS